MREGVQSISNGCSFSSRCRAASIALCLGLLLVGRVSAQPAGDVQATTIVVQAPPGCAEASTLEPQVRARLAPNPPGAASALALYVSITKRTGRVRAEISLRSAVGAVRARSIDAPTCKEAVDAAALIGALLMEPLAGTRAPAPAPTPATPPESELTKVALVPVEPLPKPAAAQSEAESIKQPRELRVGVITSALVISGVAPQVRPGVGLSVIAGGLPIPALELGVRAGARMALPHDERRAQGQVAFRWWSAVVALCAGWSVHGLVTVAGCAASELGQLRARGVNARNSRRSVRPWAALGPGLAVTWQMGRHLSLDASGEALFPLLRDRFLLADQVVHDVPGLTFRAQLSLLFRIW